MTNKKMIMYVYGDITTDARVQRAANALCSVFDVTVLSHDKGKKVEDGAYHNVLLKGWKGHPFLATLGTVFQAYKLIKQEKPEFVYAHDYYSSLLCKLLLKRKYCKKVVYDAHELIIPEEGKKMGFREKLYYNAEKSIVNKVDFVVCASEERAQMMKDHYQLSSTPLAIKNISQLVLSDDEKTKSILNDLEEFFAKPGITVVYAGVVTKSRRIGELLKAVSYMAPKFKLLVVGNGDALAELREEAAKHDNLVSAFTGGVPYRSLGSILNQCDIGFIYYPTNSLNNIYCASNKIYEYASVGLPMFSNDNPTVKKMLKESQIGISTDDFENGLKKIAEDKEIYKKNCSVFTENNKWEDEANRLRQAILNIK